MSTGVPLGYFYDIQNCPFPPNKDPIDCVQLLREKFGAKGSEQEFVVACDVQREKPEIIEALEYALLTVPNVDCESSATKLLEIYLTNFATSHRDEKGTIVLITSDEGFRSQIHDLRYKKHFHVILLHGHNVTPAFLKFPNEHYNFYELFEGLSDVKAAKKPNLTLVKAYLLPVPHGSYTQKFSKRDCQNRLNQIFRCRSGDYDPERMSASLRFKDMNEAQKVRYKAAEYVYGHPVKLVYPECKSWRESGDCVNRESCEYFHFADAKGAGPQESIEDLVRPKLVGDADRQSSDISALSNGGFAALAASQPKRSADASWERSHYQPYSVSSLFPQPRQQHNLLQSKSLYVGPLSNSITQEWLDGEGKRLSGLTNAALKIQPDGTRYAFFNFNTPEATKDAKDKLEELKAEHLKDENEDIFLSNTAIRFRELKTVNYESKDISNPTRCKVVYVGGLNTNVTQNDLNTIGATKLLEYGWNSTSLKGSNFYNYAFFHFNTHDGAALGKLKLIQLKEKELRNIPSHSVFTTLSKICYAPSK